MQTYQIKPIASRMAEQIPKELMARYTAETGLIREEIAIAIEMDAESATGQKKKYHYITSTMESPMAGARYMVEEETEKDYWSR